MDPIEKRKKELAESLRKEFGIIVPELQQKDKFVTLDQFGIGIQNDITRGGLSSKEDAAEINKRAEIYIARCAEIVKVAAEAAEGETMESPMIPIFEGAQVDKLLASDGKSPELSLDADAKKLFEQLLEKLGNIAPAKTEKTADEIAAEKKKADEIAKQKEIDDKKKIEKSKPFVWEKDMGHKEKEPEGKVSFAPETVVEKTEVQKKAEEVAIQKKKDEETAIQKKKDEVTAIQKKKDEVAAAAAA